MLQNQETRLKMREKYYRKVKKQIDNKKPQKGVSESIQSVVNETPPTVVRKENPSQINEVKEEIEEHTDGFDYNDSQQKKKIRQKEEIQAKRDKEQAEREKFVKEMTEKKVAERAEIIRQAKKLILYRRPMCRKINRALLVSECLRELDDQVALQKAIGEMEKEYEAKYIDIIKSDVMKYKQEEKKKTEEHLAKTRNYSAELRKQIEENTNRVEVKKKEEFEAEKQDQINMNKYSQLLREYEAEEISKKKKKLQQFFKDAIDEKRRFELQQKRQEELEDKALEVYQNAKARIRQLHKKTTLREKEERERRAQLIMKSHETSIDARKVLEEAILKKVLDEQEASEREKEKARKERENAMVVAIKNFQGEVATTKAKKNEEEKNLRAWEMMQRFKREEYNKEVAAEERKREWKKKMDYASVLRKSVRDIEKDKKQEAILEEKATNMKAVAEKANQQILDYAEEVVKESKGVRPLYPIFKAIEECKKEMASMAPRKQEQVLTETKPRRKMGIKCACPKFVPGDKLCFL